MQKVTVVCEWRSEHEVEVPDDFEDTGHLGDFPAEALEEMRPDTAELVSWKVYTTRRRRARAITTTAGGTGMSVRKTLEELVDQAETLVQDAKNGLDTDERRAGDLVSRAWRLAVEKSGPPGDASPEAVLRRALEVLRELLPPDRGRGDQRHLEQEALAFLLREQAPSAQPVQLAGPGPAPLFRVVVGTVYGDSWAELEAAAIDRARELSGFTGRMALEHKGTYYVYEVPCTMVSTAGGKKLYAEMSVAGYREGSGG